MALFHSSVFSVNEKGDRKKNNCNFDIGFQLFTAAVPTADVPFPFSGCVTSGVRWCRRVSCLFNKTSHQECGFLDEIEPRT